MYNKKDVNRAHGNDAILHAVLLYFMVCASGCFEKTKQDSPRNEK